MARKFKIATKHITKLINQYNINHEIITTDTELLKTLKKQNLIATKLQLLKYYKAKDESR